MIPKIHRCNFCLDTKGKLHHICAFLLEIGEGSRSGRKTICGRLSRAPYWGPGPQLNSVCVSDWELSPRPFDWQAGVQSAEPHQPGPFFFSFSFFFFFK